MEQLKKIFSSYVTMVILLAIYAIGLAVATFVEKVYDTMLAKVLIYYSPLFFLLQFLLVVNFILITLKHRYHKSGRWGYIFIHFSFIVILFGALISHISGREGVLHLREGERSNQIVSHTNRGQQTYALPFEVELVKFTLKRYPGSMSPSSFESELLVHVDGETRKELVYMNNVLDVKGYRLFQASFDSDERGTILSVNKDVAGRNVTYTGYLLLLVGSILCLVMKNGRLRTLYRQIKKQKAPSKLLLIVFLSGISLFAMADGQSPSMIKAIQQIQISPLHAQKFGALPLQATNGRIIPVNTFSSEVLRKLYKDTKFGSLDSDQFLLSVLAVPEMWMHVPFIAVPNEEVASYLELGNKKCSYQDMFDANGNYKLQDKLDEAYHKMQDRRTTFDKEIIKLDEKINIFHQLISYQMINLFPNADDPDHNWYAPGDDLSVYKGQDSVFVASIFYNYLADVRAAIKSGDWSDADEILDMISKYQYSRNTVPNVTADKVDLELKYNKLEVFRWCKIGYLSLGGLLLLFSFITFFRNSLWLKWLIRILTVCVLFVFVFQMLGMGMRWKIGGYAPWSNSYETMIYAAWATVCAGLIFSRRSSITFALATLFAGIILFVSSLNWMDPQINPLVPVLKSPWLMFHVAIIMSSYGFFGIGFLIGLLNLIFMSVIRKDKLTTYSQPIRELTIINEMALIIGLLLMTIGSFMGAVWANESWGRYWGWDPKETWALITIVVYVIVTHIHLIRKWYNLWLFNLCSVIAFASVLMTYFGVNFFLSGMHSYGQNDHISGIFVYLYVVAGLVVLLAVFARKGRVLK
ncbi:MAG: cytochrome c biogenesis protein CcsA [Tannerella sp.]|jgi:cytochrome c-type biogenesis protein CcsB|nr:cytochrome c biogenesis protein CcsA [Tannerella sp.]